MMMPVGKAGEVSEIEIAERDLHPVFLGSCHQQIKDSEMKHTRVHIHTHTYIHTKTHTHTPTYRTQR
jgi:hypothetical protein